MSANSSSKHHYELRRVGIDPATGQVYPSEVFEFDERDLSSLRNILQSEHPLRTSVKREGAPEPQELDEDNAKPDVKLPIAKRARTETDSELEDRLDFEALNKLNPEGKKRYPCEVLPREAYVITVAEKMIDKLAVDFLGLMEQWGEGYNIFDPEFGTGGENPEEEFEDSPQWNPVFHDIAERSEKYSRAVINIAWRVKCYHYAMCALIEQYSIMGTWMEVNAPGQSYMGCLEHGVVVEERIKEAIEELEQDGDLHKDLQEYRDWHSYCLKEEGLSFRANYVK